MSVILTLKLVSITVYWYYYVKIILFIIDLLHKLIYYKSISFIFVILHINCMYVCKDKICLRCINGDYYQTFRCLRQIIYKMFQSPSNKHYQKGERLMHFLLEHCTKVTSKSYDISCDITESRPRRSLQSEVPRFHAPFAFHNTRPF